MRRYDNRIEALSAPFDEKEIKPCAYGDCKEKAIYPAPRTRENLRDYLYFCLEHVRAYNAAWNYYKDLPPHEIDAIRQADMIWHRPCWKTGAHAKTGGLEQLLRDALFEFEQSCTIGPDPKKKTGYRYKKNDTSSNDSPTALTKYKALRTLGLSESTTAEDIKTRYLKLVKQLHPDLNGGSTRDQDRLCQVIEAYRHLVQPKPR